MKLVLTNLIQLFFAISLLGQNLAVDSGKLKYETLQSGDVLVTFDRKPSLHEVGNDTILIDTLVASKWFVTCDSSDEPIFEEISINNDSLILESGYYRVYTINSHYPKTFLSNTPVIEVNPNLAFQFSIDVAPNPSVDNTMAVIVNSNMPFRLGYYGAFEFPLGSGVSGLPIRIWTPTKGMFFLIVEFELPCGQIKVEKVPLLFL